MSFPVPKRTEGLLAVNTDDNNYKTPLRPKSFFPKRISELSPLESSDDDDSKIQTPDVLNDSFLCTPSSKYYQEIENNPNIINGEIDKQSTVLPEIPESTENVSDVSNKKGLISRQLNFKNVSVGGIKLEKERSTISLFSKIQSNNSNVSKTTDIRDSDTTNSPQNMHQKSQTIKRLIGAQAGIMPTKSSSFEDKLIASLDHVDASTVKRTISAPMRAGIFDDKQIATSKSNSFEDTKIKDSISELCTPKITSKSDDSCNQSNLDSFKVDTVTKAISQVDLKDETPYKTFQMPSTRRLPTSNRLLSSNTSKKCRSAMENEFRSQKVLFTTPSAVSRPTIQLMNNFGLDDSLQCYKSSPIASNLSPVKEERNIGIKSKLQLQPQSHTNALHATNNVMPVDTNKNVSISNLVSEPNADNEYHIDGEKKKILRINGKDFIIQKKIGQGGSSSVFLAEHKDSKLECALKVVDLRGDPALIEGYVKEVKILANLQDNVNVIRLYEYAIISSENMLYMVMEKGDSDLRKVLQLYKTSLPLYTLMNLWHQMLQSVNYIHQNDVIHSDLKPENFLMVRGRLKLIDFGISSKIAVDATSIIKYSQVGTFNYISPEALMDTSTGNSPMSKKNQPKIKISTKSDVWSLGCILYLLLYKKTPFAHIKNVYAKMQAIIDPNKEIEYQTLPNYYPVMLVEMAQQCLRHNPKERGSVADLLSYPFDMVIPIDK